MKGLRNLQFVMLTLLALVFYLLPVMAFAGTSGVAGDEIMDMLINLLKDNTAATAIYTAIVTLIGVGVRIGLKKVPTTMKGIVSTIIWKFMAFLFGSGVMLEKNTDMAFVKKELTKRFPLLKIDVKKLG